MCNQKKKDLIKIFGFYTLFIKNLKCNVYDLALFVTTAMKNTNYSEYSYNCMYN